MAFQQYRLGDAIGFSPWVGLMHFRMFFASPDVLRIIRNTLAISILNITIGLASAIVLAILISEVRGRAFTRFVQTVSYLPHFISWVVVGGLVFDFLSLSGSLNDLLLWLGILREPVVFLGEPRYFWPVVVGTNLWKEVGWNSIIFLAVICSINPELYEAASIDGAGRMGRIWHITLSGIRPTIVLMLIMLSGTILDAGFEQVYILTNSLMNKTVFDTSEIIETYVFRVGISQGRYSFATAVGVVKSVVNILLLVGANSIARSIADESLW
jgi:putative aldouronate transport system permease protein